MSIRRLRLLDAREIAQLKREKLEIQRRTLELAEREKWDRDILFYNSLIDPTLPPIQQQKLLEMKMEINERYNLDYVGNAGCVVPNDILVRRRDFLSWFLLKVLMRNSLSASQHNSPKSPREKNKMLMSHVPKVYAPRRHVRGDKLIVVFK
ncbi:hypothetical protein Tco_0336563 [Tanacetum coccineum]